MIGTVGAIVASAVIGGGVSLLSGAMQANAADKAAQAQVSASDKATQAQVESTDKQIALAKETRDLQRADLQPWRTAGEQALTQIQAGIADGSFDPAKFDFQADPGYQFRLDQGTKALERSASARGSLNSASTETAVNAFAQDYASNEFNNAYARNATAKATNFNNLLTVSNSGQAAAGGQAAATGQAGQTINYAVGTQGNALATGATNTGNALAEGYTNQGNAWSDAFSGVATSANTGLENYLLFDALKAA